MMTREELDDVPYGDKAWLKPLPKHLRATAVAVQDYFEMQPVSHRVFKRSKMRAWLTDMAHRAWLVEQHCRLQQGVSLFQPNPGDLILIDAASDAKNLRRRD